VTVDDDAELATLVAPRRRPLRRAAPAGRRAVRNAIATNVLSGWHPSTDEHHPPGRLRRRQNQPGPTT